jgi:hypothetical protein
MYIQFTSYVSVIKIKCAYFAVHYRYFVDEV